MTAIRNSNALRDLVKTWVKSCECDIIIILLCYDGFDFVIKIQDDLPQISTTNFGNKFFLLNNNFVGWKDNLKCETLKITKQSYSESMLISLIHLKKCDVTRVRMHSRFVPLELSILQMSFSFVKDWVMPSHMDLYENLYKILYNREQFCQLLSRFIN